MCYLSAPWTARALRYVKETVGWSHAAPSTSARRRWPSSSLAQRPLIRYAVERLQTARTPIACKGVLQPTLRARHRAGPAERARGRVRWMIAFPQISGNGRRAGEAAPLGLAPGSEVFSRIDPNATAAFSDAGRSPSNRPHASTRFVDCRSMIRKPTSITRWSTVCPRQRSTMSRAASLPMAAPSTCTVVRDGSM